MATDSSAKKTTSNRGGSSTGTGRSGRSSSKAGTRSGTRSGTRTVDRAAIAKQDRLRDEIVFFVVLMLCILLFIANLGIGGKVSYLISSLLFGLFGFMSYVFPVVLFVVIAYAILSKYDPKSIESPTFRIIVGCLFFFALCVLCELIKGGELSPAAAFGESFSERNGGGFMGALASYILMQAFGRVGAFIIDIAFILILFILFTGKSIVAFIKNSGQKIYDGTSGVREDLRETYEENRQIRRENREARREYQEQEQAERRRQRMQRVELTGVTTDTLITADKARRNPEMHELSGNVRLLNESHSLEPVKKGEAVGGLSSEALKDDEEFKVNVRYVDDSYDGVEPQEDEFHGAFEQEDRHRGLYDTSLGDDNVALFKRGNLEESDFRNANASNNTAPAPKKGEEPENLYNRVLKVEPVNPQAQVVNTANEEPEVLDLSGLSESKAQRNKKKNYETPDLDSMDDGISGERFGFGVDVEEKSEFKPEIVAPVKKPVNTMPREKTVNSVPDVQPEEQVSDTTGKADEAVDDKPHMSDTTEEKPYVFPPVSLLKNPDKKAKGDSKEHLEETAKKLEQTLANFGVRATITDVICGPTVTRYEIQPEMGVKVSKIVNLSDDIKLNLAAADIRIEAPIPGKPAIGIEVPNKEAVPVMFRELVESYEFNVDKDKKKIAFAAGKDIGGDVIMGDIAKMPHLLIAGATGSGKSVCINTVIMSILYRAKPDEVKLIMIDPKVVELSVYNGIPHLLIPVVTDPKKASGALNWAVAEMDERYRMFADYGVRDMAGFNERVAAIPEGTEGRPDKMPQIVVIVDELADLMMVAPGDVENAICRLAQLARAAGIHLIIATQRPSVNVITGIIKANMPSRIAFSVSSQVDSRTILDSGGAEKLLGKGDMLYYPQGLTKPLRVQGAFVSDGEVSAVVDFLKEHCGETVYDPGINEKMESLSKNSSNAVGNATAGAGNGAASDGNDEYFMECGRLVVSSGKASIGTFQRKFKIGFNRAARIMDQLEEAGVVSGENGTKPREVLMSEEEFEEYLEMYGG